MSACVYITVYAFGVEILHCYSKPITLKLQSIQLKKIKQSQCV